MLIFHNPGPSNFMFFDLSFLRILLTENIEVPQFLLFAYGVEAFRPLNEILGFWYFCIQSQLYL